MRSACSHCCSVTALLPPQHPINDPASTTMDSRLTAVVQDVSFAASGVFQSIGQDRKSVECSLLVDGLSKFHVRSVIPLKDGGVQGNGPEGVAEDAAEQVGLSFTLGFDGGRHRVAAR